MKGWTSMLWLLLMAALHGPAAGQTLSASGSCEAYIYLSPDIPGLVQRSPCNPLLGAPPGSVTLAEAAAGNARLGGSARIEARSQYGHLGAAASWTAHADAGASAALFAMGGKVTARAGDFLSVGGAIGGPAIPVDVSMVVSWDSAVSGNDTRERDAWMLEAALELSFAAGPMNTVPATRPLTLSFCGATDNNFDLAGPGLSLICTRQGYGAQLAVLSGSFLAPPGSTNALNYSLSTSASFGGLHGSVGAADGALSAGGYLSAMNSLQVFVSSTDPRADLRFSSGAGYLAPVPESSTWAMTLAGLAMLLGWPVNRPRKR